MSFVLKGSETYRLANVLNSMFPLGIEVTGKRAEYMCKKFIELDSDGLTPEAVSVIKNAMQDPSTPDEVQAMSAKVQEMDEDLYSLWVPESWVVQGVPNG